MSKDTLIANLVRLVWERGREEERVRKEERVREDLILPVEDEERKKLRERARTLAVLEGREFREGEWERERGWEEVVLRRREREGQLNKEAEKEQPREEPTDVQPQLEQEREQPEQKRKKEQPPNEKEKTQAQVVASEVQGNVEEEKKRKSLKQVAKSLKKGLKDLHCPSKNKENTPTIPHAVPRLCEPCIDSLCHGCRQRGR